MKCTAKVMGVIFENPPYYILRCLVATETSVDPKIVKGKIPGVILRGSVFTFQGTLGKDKSGRPAFNANRSPVSLESLSGEAQEKYLEWATKDDIERSQMLSVIADCGANPRLLNSLWGVIRGNLEGVRNNPWMLVDMGLPFMSADMVARALNGGHLGEMATHHNRVSSAALWSTIQGAQNGHTFLDSNTVFSDTANLTGLSSGLEIAKCIKKMGTDKRIVIEKYDDVNGIYHPSFHMMEREVSTYIKDRVKKVTENTYSESYIRSFSPYALTDKQVEAVRSCLTEPVAVVTGLPGTGKTTILSTVVKILRTQKDSILLVAPTGIAAKRASSITGLEGVTIHRAFGAGFSDDDDFIVSDYEGIKKTDSSQPDTSVSLSTYDPTKEVWRHSPDQPRGESVVIIDEASMVDLHLMWRLLRGVSWDCRVIMVGDAEQLPPVGVGFVLKDVIKSDALPRVHLDEIFRQGEGSDITLAAHKIHSGKSLSYSEEFKFIKRSSDAEIVETLVKLCRDLTFDEKNFHVISPTHHGDAGVTNLNRELRTALNPNRGLAFVKVGMDQIRVNDKVMVTQNNYDLGVYNGDIGRVDKIGKDSLYLILNGTGIGQRVEIPTKEARLLRLAYATTVHKSQGQEYDTVIIPMTKRHGNLLLKRSLIYTAVTRAKKKVILIGDQEAITRAIMNVEEYGEFSRLSSRLKGEIL